MKNLIIVCSFLFFSCKSDYKVISVATKNIDKMSIRTLNMDLDNLWFTGSGSKFGKISFENDSLEIIQIDDSKTEYRSSAITTNNFFILSIENPARLIKINKQTNMLEVVYKEKNEKVFYDSMIFKNDDFGVAIGDPTEDCLSVIITENKGDNWVKIPCDNLPKIVEGEAAFAASNTNVKVIGKTIFIVSGGKKSRLFKSIDKGKTWQVYETPIVQGEAMTGAFTMDFYNDKIGIIAGGNYEKPTENFNNKAMTFDGGKTWKLMAQNDGFGYASCVQFMPESKGKVLFSCGATGVFYSKNGGNTWKKILEDVDFYTLRFKDSNTLYLAGKNKITKLVIE